MVASRGRQAAGGRSAPGRERGRSVDPKGEPPGLEADPESVARLICLQQLERAPRTRAELHRVLTDRSVPAEVAEQVLARFAAVGLIDDALFAELWVSSRHRGRGLAGRALSQELRRKGVDEQVVRAAVEGLAPEQELATARLIVQRRLGSTRGLATEVRVRRLTGLLARKGYPAGTCFQVVREALAAEGAAGDLDEVDALSEADASPEP